MPAWLQYSPSRMMQSDHAGFTRALRFQSHDQKTFEVPYTCAEPHAIAAEQRQHKAHVDYHKVNDGICAIAPIAGALHPLLTEHSRQESTMLGCHCYCQHATCASQQLIMEAAAGMSVARTSGPAGLPC